MTYSGAYNRRRVDPLFAERWRQALEEGYVRMEAMLIARACGTADTPELARAAAAEDAEDAGSLLDVTQSFDSVLALQLMSQHRKALHGGTRRLGGPRPTAATPDELADAILKQLSALNKRRGGQG